MASPNQEPSLSPLAWAIAWERQILLEILRDTEPTQETPALLERLQDRDLRKVRPAFPSPRQLAAQAALRCNRHETDDAAGSDTRALEEKIAAAVEAELAASIAVLKAQGATALGDRLELLICPEILFRSPTGTFVEANTESEFWGMWYPGLDNEDATMGDILQSLPGVGDAALPREVRWFEDPASSIALPGAVSLEWHDAIHILLGRGLLDQDEAFVVGFTMGNSSSFCNEDAVTLRNAFAHAYPEPYRVHGMKLSAFDIGIEAGRAIGKPDLADQEGKLSNNATLRRWREHLGIPKELLRPFFVRESLMIPRTLETARLPVSPGGDRKTSGANASEEFDKSLPKSRAFG